MGFQLQNFAGHMHGVSTLHFCGQKEYFLTNFRTLHGLYMGFEAHQIARLDVFFFFSDAPSIQTKHCRDFTQLKILQGLCMPREFEVPRDGAVRGRFWMEGPRGARETSSPPLRTQGRSIV